MATTRRVNRNQKAEYAGGSRAKGWYVYSIQGIEENGPRKQYFSIDGERKAESKDAIQSAWQAAREWVAEFGEVTKNDNEYKAIRQ